MTNQRPIFDKTHPENYQITIEVGDMLSEHGLTRMTLAGDGHVTAEWLGKIRGAVETAKQLPTHYTGTLKHHDPIDLLLKASQFNWDRKFPSRPGIPDEAIVVWQFGEKGAPGAEVKVWLREAEKDPLMGPLLQGLREELADLSDNHIYL
ncbi:hypothetical protein EDC61_10169 [Sulfuritortus calidifontis]|uniref:Uncharacterized protein n=1 Tax=Sulfuritortus calidifontis TaxID=1914471 RepID=A0A4V6NYS7_9PROT|nr:hypothetical protein [Sulfuritortus calidifontis]TCS73847.1 hypothetical protein EDC61_10169 [Sulfuritortus calidifontis]